MTTIASADNEGRAPTAARSAFASLLRRWPLYLGVAALLAGLWFMFDRNHDTDPPYRFGQLDRGQITRTVSATGALQPLVSVSVGSTVSGPVQDVLVDFNATVRAGQVLARLDPQAFVQRVTQSAANLAEAEARAGAAEADYQRYVLLAQRGFASAQLLQQQRAARDAARAVVAQASAALEGARIDLDRSIIRSPIDGVVVDRQINPGQSVAASFQAPTLFIIAQDLSRLQANITVDEADIGEVREGQVARFRVDAYPDRAFEARVSQVRQQGADVQGVVSYTVVVEADNPDHTLLPGMTANAEIVIEQVSDVLRVPSAALRFRPQGQDGQSRAGARTRAPSGVNRQAQRTREATVWVLREGKPAPLAIRIGVADGTYTQVASGALKQGDDVIIGGGPEAEVRLQGPLGGPPMRMGGP